MIFPSNHLRDILFVDIETASQQPSFTDLSAIMQIHWQRKMRYLVKAEEYPTFEEEFSALYHDRAAIFAEFGQVICISVGYLTETKQIPTEAEEVALPSISMKVKTLSGSGEKQILTAFSTLLQEYWYDRHNQFLCGHNIKEFDVPFLCRRMLALGMPLPNLLKIAGQRPWQVHHVLDTMELWKFGDYKHYTSLDLLCTVLQIESPKGEMDGSQVSEAFWDGRIEEIAHYCQKDVVATARVYLKCIGSPLFSDEQVTIVD